MRFIGPSLSGRIGCKFPRKNLPPPMHEGERTDVTAVSTEALKRVFTQNADWRDTLEAADELGRRAGRLDDVEALGFVVSFCQDEESRKTAMEKLSLKMHEIRDPRVLEFIVMNTDDEKAKRLAIEILGQRTDDVTSTFTLVHIALCARKDFVRRAATIKLAGKADALNVISLHSEFDDTRAYAKELLQAIG
jgi:hypothetical protein